MIKFCCPNCGKQFEVADDWAGKKARCKNCGNSFMVPMASIAEPPRVPRAQRPFPVPVASTAEPPPVPVAQQAVEPCQRIVVSFADSRSPTKPKDEVERVDKQRQVERKPPMRIRRLIADAEQMSRVFAHFPLICIVSVEGNPPDKYRIEYNVRGLARSYDGQPIYRDQHLVEIQLTSDYPRQSPKCRMLTPIFHPNFDPSIICVGDHWTAAEKLADLVVRIGEMIAYQAYNIKSPLDGEAAMWADMNQNALPVDKRSLVPPEA